MNQEEEFNCWFQTEVISSVTGFVDTALWGNVDKGTVHDIWKSATQAQYDKHQAEIAMLREVLESIKDGRSISSADKCIHGQYGYEPCETCLTDIAEQALSTPPTKWLENKLAEARRQAFKQLTQLTDEESEFGLWQITLRYDNHQDGAHVINGNDVSISSCYDLDKEPDEQFCVAIEEAIRNKEKADERVQN